MSWPPARAAFRTPWDSIPTHPRRPGVGRNDFSRSITTSAPWRSSTGSVRKTRNEVISDMDSILLKGGTIIDGTGAAPRQGDVLFSGATITDIGSFTAPADARVIDCHGLAV